MCPLIPILFGIRGFSLSSLFVVKFSLYSSLRYLHPPRLIIQVRLKTEYRTGAFLSSMLSML